MARNDNGRIEFEAHLDVEQLRRDAAAATATIRKIGDGAEAEGNRIDSVFKKIGGSMAAMFTLQQAGAFAKAIVNVRGEIEALEISFETLLGNRGKAEALMSEIKSFAANTPMQMGDLAKGAQTLLGFNIEAEKVMAILRQIGDISMGSSEKFNSLVLAFSQMSSTGKLMGQDLLQMINAGFNPLVTISEQTGKSIAQLKDEMSAGAISADMVAAAFAAAAGEGGKFYGMLDKQSEGVKGSLSNLQGAIDDMLNEIGTGSQGVITGVVGAATEAVKNYKEIGEAIAAVVVMFGVYKAAVMTTVATEKAVVASTATATVAAANAEIAAYARLLPTKEANAYADIAAAVASGKLTVAKAEELIVIRTEIAAKQESMRIEASKAALEVRNAKQAIINARLTLSAKKEALIASKAELDAAIASGNAKTIASAQTKYDTAVAAQNAAARDLRAKKIGLETLQENAQTKAKALNTFATEVNTVAETGNTVSTNVLTAAKQRLMAVMVKLRVAMLKHPYALAAAAVIALSYGIYKLVTHQTDAEKAQKKLNETIKEGAQTVESERVEVDILFNRLKNAKKGTEEWDAARKAIINKYGGYLKLLGDEKTALDNIAEAQRLVTEEVVKSARARMMESATREAADTLAKKESEVYKNIYEQIHLAVKDKVEADALVLKIKPVIDSGSKLPADVYNALSEANKKVTEGLGTFESRRIINLGFVEDQLKQLNDLKNTTYETISDLRNMYGDLSVEKPDTENVFDVLNASLAQLESELPKAKAKLEELENTEIDYTTGNATQQTVDLEKAISRQKELIAAIEAAKLAREEELRIIREVEDQIKKLKYEQEGYATDDKEYADIEARIARLQTKLPKSSKTAASKEAKDYSAELAKQARDEIRAIEDLEYQKERVQIEMQKDGFDKEMKLLKLEHDRKIIEIERQHEELIDTLQKNARKEWEAANPDAEKSGMRFENSEEYKALPSKLEESGKHFIELKNAENAEYEQSAANLRDGLLKEFEDYQAKRERITKEYEAKIAKLEEERTDTNSDATTRAIAEAKRRRDRTLAEIDDMTVSTTDTLYKLYSDMSEKSVAEIKKITKEAEAMLNFILTGEYDREIAEGFGLTEAQFNTLVEKFKHPEELEAFRRQIKGLKNDVAEFEGLLQKIQAGFRDVFNSGGDTKKLREGFGKIETGLSSAIDFGKEFADVLREIAFEGGALAGVAETLSGVLGVLNNTLQEAGKGAQVGAQAGGGWGALIGAVAGAGKGFLTSIYSLKMAGWQQEYRSEVLIAEMQRKLYTAEKEINRMYRERYDWSQKIGESNLDYAARVGEELKKQLAETEKDTIDYWEKLMNSEYYSRFDDGKRYGSWFGWDISAADVDPHWTDPVSLAGKSLKEIQYLYAKGLLTDEAKAWYEMWKQANEEHSELAQRTAEEKERLREQTVGSTRDSIVDSIVDGFKAGKRSAADFADTFEELMQNAVAASLESLADQRVQQWYEDFAAMGEGGYTSSEIERAQKDYLAIIESLARDAAALEQVAGMHIGAKEERTASAKGFASMTQDSAEELNGRFMAMQALAIEDNMNFKVLVQNSAAVLKHLAGIENNTSRLENIEYGINSIKTGINDMNLKGLILRG
jgi:tape measure domain-containing protein